MRILFIEPCAPNFHIYTKISIPRLGCLVLAALARQRGLDAEVFIEGDRMVSDAAIESSDIVAISTTTSTAPRAYQLARKAGELGKWVILGGSHVSFQVEEALSHAPFVVRGEGEKALVAFLDELQGSQDWSKVPNLSWLVDGEIRHNPMTEPLADLDAVPIPDFSLITQRMRGLTPGRVLPVQTSRGCPFDCTFCSVTKMFGRRYRYRSTPNVMAELKQYDSPRTFVFFNDDNFAEHRERTVDLLREMIRRKLRLTWSTQVRAGLARDINLIRLMKRAGCRTVYIGFESINPDSLDSVNKRQGVADLERAARGFRRAGIAVHGMFIFGLEDDTTRSLEQTVVQARKWELDSVQFMVLTPLPGTETFYQLEDEGRILFDDWSLFDAHHVVFQPRWMSPIELQYLQIKAHNWFYSRGSMARRFISGRFHDLAITAYARHLNAQWRRFNKEWMRTLASLSVTPFGCKATS
ncbi:B12-binding domain-containing radical SAM protein [bacterium]|nr:B12-binding domain-containing radical SAM protein [candidate division CSSED10-310 bacterium]